MLALRRVHSPVKITNPYENTSDFIISLMSFAVVVTSR
jgi:hypothetical protein